MFSTLTYVSLVAALQTQGVPADLTALLKRAMIETRSIVAPTPAVLLDGPVWIDVDRAVQKVNEVSDVAVSRADIVAVLAPGQSAAAPARWSEGCTVSEGGVATCEVQDRGLRFSLDELELTDETAVLVATAVVTAPALSDWGLYLFRLRLSFTRGRGGWTLTDVQELERRPMKVTARPVPSDTGTYDGPSERESGDKGPQWSLRHSVPPPQSTDLRMVTTSRT
jgi:hypothetical protein